MNLAGFLIVTGLLIWGACIACIRRAYQLGIHEGMRRCSVVEMFQPTPMTWDDRKRRERK